MHVQTTFWKRKENKKKVTFIARNLFILSKFALNLFGILWVLFPEDLESFTGCQLFSKHEKTLEKWVEINLTDTFFLAKKHPKML